MGLADCYAPSKEAIFRAASNRGASCCSAAFLRSSKSYDPLVDDSKADAAEDPQELNLLADAEESEVATSIVEVGFFPACNRPEDHVGEFLDIRAENPFTVDSVIAKVQKQLPALCRASRLQREPGVETRHSLAEFL